MTKTFIALLLLTCAIPFLWLFLAQSALQCLTVDQMNRFLREVNKPTHRYKNVLGGSYGFARFLFTPDARQHPVLQCRYRLRALRLMLLLFIALVVIEVIAIGTVVALRLPN